MVRLILKGHLSWLNNCSPVSGMDKGALPSLTPRWTCNLSLPSVPDGQSPVFLVTPHSDQYPGLHFSLVTSDLS